LLVRFLTWRWQFYLNIPLSLIGLATAWWALAGLPQPKTREKLDWWGIVLLTICLLSLNIALLNSGDVQSAGGFADLEPGSSTLTWPFYLVALITFILFIFVERRVKSEERGAKSEERRVKDFRPWPLAPRPSVPPLIDLTLFRRRNFTPAILINFLVGCVLIIAMVNVPLVINVLAFEVGTAALISGTLLSGMTAAMAVMAYIGGRLTERFSYRPVTLAGLLLCAIGFGFMGFSWQVGTPYGQMSWQLVILGMGFGLVIAPVGTAVINAAPDHQRGISASLVIVLRLIGMSVGLSGLTAWGLQRFSRLRSQIQLPDLPFTDPLYQQAVVEGLSQVAVQVLTETFLVSAVVALLALAISFGLRRDV
jgi:MFS family permease